jgi:O-antigen ligase
MSLIPEFELGLWNGWIFALPVLLVWLSGLIVNKDKWVEAPLNEKEKPISSLSWLVVLILFIYPTIGQSKNSYPPIPVEV